MSWRMFGTFLFVFLVTAPLFAGDRDPDSQSLRGIPKGHRHMWAVIGGTALGAGLGAIPGGASNVFKGALVGGSGASALYLVKHRGQEGPWSHVITNAGLVAGIGWIACDCGAGGGAGALVGGGATALAQAFKTRNRSIAAVTGAGTGNSSSSQDQSQDQAPQAQQPQTQPAQSEPPPPPPGLPDAPRPKDH